jgi:hypothetical protein
MNSTIVGLVAAIAVLSGGLGLSLTDIFEDQNLVTSNAVSSGTTGFLMGQVIIEAKNADGEVIAYRQTDNEVVDDGEQCILKMLFSSNYLEAGLGRGEYTTLPVNTEGSEYSACTGALTQAWDVIAIGTTAATVADKLVKLAAESTADGLGRKVADTKTWYNGTGGSNADNTKIVLKRTFTSTGSHTIVESGLFNSTTPGGSGMLAYQTFTGVVLTTGDSITVQWTFTVDD